ncbi:MAG: HflC protein [Chloroflexi bacterium]|nr:HflC protein [Chloroflexota bacterium]
MNPRNLVIIFVIALFIIVPQIAYVVDQTQIAIVTRFGEYQKTSSNPGLKFKTPFAEQVIKFDNRLLRVDAAPASILTADKRNLVIDSYARYRIVDPLQFYKSLRNEVGAASRVGDIVNAQLRQEVALDLQEEVISEKREDIMHRVTEASNRIEVSRESVLETYGSINHDAIEIFIDESLTDRERGRPALQQEVDLLVSNPMPESLSEFSITYTTDIEDIYGIRIVDVRIKRADFPPDIETSVFLRMEAERERIASGLRAEGSQKDAEIRADVDKQVNIILKSAEGTSARLYGEAEEQAINILAEALEKDPEFYEFRRTLEAYEKFLDEETTIILDPNSDLLKYLMTSENNE